MYDGAASIMIATLQIPENILQAHHSGHRPFKTPFSSFAQLFYARVQDPALSHHTFLSFYDDDSPRTYTYAQFGGLVERTVTFLRDHIGVRHGDRIATILSNHDHTVIVYFAAWVLGAVVVPINMEESGEQKHYILEHSEARFVFCWPKRFDEILALSKELPHLKKVIPLPENPSAFRNILHGAKPTQLLPEGDLHDDALIVYTSGTTGPPKGVIVTAENLLVDADAITSWHGFNMGESLMCILPIHHVNGIVVTLVTPFYFKGKSVLTRRFHPATFWHLIQNEQVHCVSVVPTILEILLETPFNVDHYHLDHFRGVICGAGPLLKETASRFEDRFHFPIYHGYGLSETTCYSCFLPVNLSMQAHRRWLTTYDYPSIGVPIAHNDMAILDDQGHPLPEMTSGEICIRGQTVCSGYLKRPDANEAAFQWGWFRSGDTGFFDRDDQGRPYFFISGRLKEVIIRGGVNISPLEIDEVLRAHPSVKFAMTIPFDNRYYGEEIAGYIVPHKGIPHPSNEEILQFCRQTLPFAKCPKVILFGEDIPYTTTGKPKRLELKTRLRDALHPYRNFRFQDNHRTSK